MKSKAIFLAAVLVMMPFVLHAQWRVGALGGLDYNIHSQDVHYMTDYSVHGGLGFDGGISGQYSFNKWLGVRADLMFTHKNWNLTRYDLADIDHFYFNSYLLLPVMASFSFGGDSPLSGFVNLGGYTGYWIDSHRTGTDVNVLTAKTYAFSEKIALNAEKDNRLDAGAVAGLGMEYRWHKHWAAQMETRCYYSVASQVKEYMKVKDYRYDTTVALHVGIFYIF
ncbi:MAG: PorT family protein [Bacteroidales bacterium]|nr:PorT family protein [Bacteroidales bacterium]